MNWFRIEKENAVQPAKGSYKDWKEMLAEEGGHQCVYCAISENSFGGIRNFHVEHYRPKSIKRFEPRKNDIRNLYYACPICNTFKSDDWPNDPTEDLSQECYAEPSVVNYAHLFLLTTTSEIIGKNVAARYMVEKLYLNRPQLIMERKQQQLLNNLKRTVQRLAGISKELVGSSDAISAEFLIEYIEICPKIMELWSEAERTILYKTEDVSREEVA